MNKSSMTWWLLINVISLNLKNSTLDYILLAEKYTQDFQKGG